MPGRNALKLAGGPTMASASVAGTVPPALPSARPHTAVAVCAGSLTDVAVSVTVPEGDAPSSLATYTGTPTVSPNFAEASASLSWACQPVPVAGADSR